ncbi:hypothetical protein JVT61DRAFT_7291 [Boletus reticuloceps]|uniref:Transcription factor CBF/NF-Y/archaeal histone domain-containing protein n=1 Tax=Boletus reticuloceps TaxID=495285 RepID=A0A8I2YJK9_9AGAM|nr:hypothetical protein JVT61DRAFT_7291 [Boletus reticuloceps]
MDTEHTDTQEQVIQAESMIQPDADGEATPQVDKEVDQTRDKRDGKKEIAAPRDREPGKSILPFSRVQRIIKADKVRPASRFDTFYHCKSHQRDAGIQELPMVAKDATLLISLATEEFIKRLSQACQRLAEGDKRATVQQKDVANIVRRVDEFLFLEEMIGSQESTGKRKPQKARVDGDATGDQDQLQPTIRNFMQKAGENEATGETANIVTSEDGVMYAG